MNKNAYGIILTSSSTKILQAIKISFMKSSIFVNNYITMNKFLKCALLGLLTLCLYYSNELIRAQSSAYIITGQLLDNQHRHIAIPDVRIYLKSNPDKDYRSNSNGQFTISLELLKTDTLVFKHSGYQLQEKPISLSQIKKSKSGTYSLAIYMNHVTLDPFVISYQRIDTIFGSKTVSVEDYLLFENGSKLLLVYEKTAQKGGQLWYIDNFEHVLDIYHLPSVAIQFYRDYAKTCYIICFQKTYEILLQEGKIHLFTIDTDLFYGYKQRIVDSLHGYYYYSDYSHHYPAVKFMTTRIEDTTHIFLREVKDEFMMELYRAQYKYVSGRDKLWAYRKEQDTGIDKEIWIGATVFTQDLLYKPVYAPFFIQQDTILIFDQYKSYLYRYTSHHVMIDSLYVNYYKNPKGEKWEQPLLRDDVTGAIYSLYNKGGYYYIRSLNTLTGLLTTTTKISNQFVHHIKVYDGYVYYVYRPYESSQRKYLYRERINQ
jgi:hypothetical protein